MEARSLVRTSLLQLDPEPYSYLPERLALFYACEVPFNTLLLIKAYMEAFSSYWFEALKDDLEREINEKEARAPKEMDTLVDAVKYAFKELEKDPVLGSIEALDLMSLLNIDLVVDRKVLRKAAIEASLGLHVEKLHKKGLRKALPCILEMLK